MIHNVTERPMAIGSNQTGETEKPMAKENFLLDKCKNHKVQCISSYLAWVGTHSLQIDNA